MHSVFSLLGCSCVAVLGFMRMVLYTMVCREYICMVERNAR